MKNLPKAVLFDLDGTLADTIPDIDHALNIALTRCGYEGIDPGQVREWVGKGAGELIRRALISQGAQGVEADKAERDRIWEVFEGSYLENICVRTRLYDDVIETLAGLTQRDIKLACVTNKAAVFTHPLLKALNIENYFGSVVAGDSCENRKPHPEPLFKACRDLGVDADESVMVGDSVNDLGAAQAAGMKSVLVSFGYFNSPDAEREKADIMVDAFGDIIGALKKLS